MMRKTAIGVAVGLLLAAVAAHGHGPRFHKLRLVTFNRPLPAPGFTLTNPEGETVRLRDFRGRYVLLNFWATWCPPCVKEMPTMERLAEKFAARPFTVLAVSIDEEGAEKVKPFIAKLGITFPIALDPEARVSGEYGAGDLPSTFLVNPEGNVVAAAKGERDWASPEMIEFLEEVMDKAS